MRRYQGLYRPDNRPCYPALLYRRRYGVVRRRLVFDWVTTVARPGSLSYSYNTSPNPRGIQSYKWPEECLCIVTNTLNASRIPRFQPRNQIGAHRKTSTTHPPQLGIKTLPDPSNVGKRRRLSPVHRTIHFKQGLPKLRVVAGPAGCPSAVWSRAWREWRTGWRRGTS